MNVSTSGTNKAYCYIVERETERETDTLAQHEFAVIIRCDTRNECLLKLKCQKSNNFAKKTQPIERARERETRCQLEFNLFYFKCNKAYITPFSLSLLTIVYRHF